MRRFVEAHLASGEVARVLYGAIIALALIVALEDHPPTAGETVAALIGTGVAVGLAELYAELVAAEARTRQPIHRERVRAFARDSVAVAFGAAFPAVYFILAAAGAMHTHTAFQIAKWSGLGLICAYGFLGARLSGAGPVRALGQTLVVGVIGIGLIVFKSLTH